MITKPRWEAECQLVRDFCPAFRPFARPGEDISGFTGILVGPHSGMKYIVTLEASIAHYPVQQPAVYIEPRPEPIFCDSDGRLSISLPRDLVTESCALYLLITYQYVSEFDGKPEVAK